MATVVIVYGAGPHSQVETDFLESAGHQVRHLSGMPSDGDPRLQEADALMVTLQPVTDATLAGMPRCRVIGRVGTGVDTIDLAAAERRGVYVTNVADYSVDEVSTHAITLMLAHIRRLPGYLAIVHDGGWDSIGAGPVRRLAGLTFGVLGFGRIGRATATKAAGLGLRVIACDAYQSEDQIRAAGAEPVDWPTLLAESDYLSLHAPLTDETRHLIDAAALRAMKPSATLINTARGGLIDEAALVAAVRSGTIGGALLDVLSQEPPSPDHPLLGEERVWVTPHTAWYSVQAQFDVSMRAAEDVHRVLSGLAPRSPANNPVLSPAAEAAP